MVETLKDEFGGYSLPPVACDEDLVALRGLCAGTGAEWPDRTQGGGTWGRQVMTVLDTLVRLVIISEKNEPLDRIP